MHNWTCSSCKAILMASDDLQLLCKFLFPSISDRILTLQTRRVHDPEYVIGGIFRLFHFEVHGR